MLLWFLEIICWWQFFCNKTVNWKFSNFSRNSSKTFTSTSFLDTFFCSNKLLSRESFSWKVSLMLNYKYNTLCHIATFFSLIRFAQHDENSTWIVIIFFSHLKNVRMQGFLPLMKNPWKETMQFLLVRPPLYHDWTSFFHF